MIFRHLFPSSPAPNNATKRWLRFQQNMAKKRWLELDREYNGPVSLWDFSRLEDAQEAAWVHETNNKGGWRTSDDSVVGGFSRARFDLVYTVDDFHSLLQGNRPLSMKDPSTISEISTGQSDIANSKNEVVGAGDDEEVPFVPFVRWKGTIDTRIPEAHANLEESGKRVQRSGFCAIRSSEYPFSGADLGGRYNGLEILCRSDGRPYSVNLKCESFIDNDMFQCFINIPPTIDGPNGEQDNATGGRFDQVVLLFQHFSVTSGGRMRATQRVLDDNIKIKSIGFTLMDGIDGDFEFDLARIRAVNYDENGVIGKVD